MNSHIARLLTDYLRRIGSGWGTVILLYAVLAQTLMTNDRGPLMVGALGGFLPALQFDRKWLRTSATLPIPRRALGVTRWLAGLASPIILMLSVCFSIVVLSAIPHGNIRLHIPNFSEAVFWTLLAWAVPGYFQSVLLVTARIDRLSQRPRRIAAAAISVVWIGAWAALYFVPTDTMTWRFLSKGFLFVALAFTIYTYRRPDILLFAGKLFRWSDRPSAHGPSARFSGWNVLRADAWRRAAILGSITALGFASAMHFREVPGARISWTLFTIPIIAIAPIPTPALAIRVMRSLPLSLTQLTAGIILTALIPQAVLLLVYGLFSAWGVVVVPVVWPCLLLSMLPLMIALRLRLGAAGIIVTIGVVLGSALTLTILLIARSVQGEALPSAQWLIALAVGAVVLAESGTIWLRQQLLSGRDRNLNSGSV